MNDISTLRSKILKLADHCVKCGLCSSQCPTYRLKQDENESPRGRIALAQGLASGAISAGSKIPEHLNSCLQCRRCEASCPSEVAYGELMNLTNRLLTETNPQNTPLMIRSITFVSKLSHKHWQSLAKIWHFLFRIQAFQLLRLNKTGRFLFKLAFTANRGKVKHEFTAVNKQHSTESVFLFTGCMSHLFDKQALQASINLLEFCGYTVSIPGKQVCCGAIAARQGLSTLEQQCQTSNQLAFIDSSNKPIVFFTPGCGSKLKEYDNQRPAEISFASRATSISHFLNCSDRFAQLGFLPFKKRVLIFTPCSESNTLKQSGITEKLLDRIPDIELINLPKNTGCCGASGSHLLTHKQQSTQIRQPILETIIQLAPDLIVSPNYPCNLHIESGLKEKNLDIPMIHPIELLFNQIKASE